VTANALLRFYWSIVLCCNNNSREEVDQAKQPVHAAGRAAQGVGEDPNVSEGKDDHLKKVIDHARAAGATGAGGDGYEED